MTLGGPTTNIEGSFFPAPDTHVPSLGPPSTASRRAGRIACQQRAEIDGPGTIAREAETERRGDREDRLTDQAGFNQSGAQKAAGTIVDPTEFSGQKYRPKKRRRFTRRELRLGDTETEDQNTR